MISRLYLVLAQIDKGDIKIHQGTVGQDTMTKVLQLVFGIAGGVALLIVTLAGFKYVLSQGNPQETAKAKNTIIGALIGVVVCLTAYSIVTFVLDKV